ncbi:MAG: TolC family protein [Deltaproteobacteria bacterium]
MSVALAVTATLAVGPPLTLDEVLKSVELHHPLVVAANTEIDVARGTLLSAEGGFDVYLHGKAGGYAAGYYEGIASEVGVRQPTTLWGTELYAGYRYGEDHPIYDAQKLTSDNGEVAAGIIVPLWRDGPIDARRAEMWQAEVGVEVAKLAANEKLRLTKLKAAELYFKWVASHEKLRIAESLLELAQQRVTGIERRVARGDIPRIELVDNERLIVSRQQGVVEARRAVQASAFALSLFQRDDDGRPDVPTYARAPGGLEGPRPVPPVRDQDIRSALARRPDLAQYAGIMKRLRTELELAENMRAPNVDLKVEGSKDFGVERPYGPDPNETTKNDTTLGLSLSFKWPAQQRKARGKIQSVSAKLRAVRAKQGFLQDVVKMEVNDAWSELSTARTRATLSRRTLELTRQVEVAERRRFELGDSSILQVNLREEATAKAAKDLVDALVTSHRAAARYRAVTAAL